MTFKPLMSRCVIGLIAFNGLIGPARAGGAFSVDDAAIGSPGECQLETWASKSTAGDFAGVSQPACVVTLGVPVEITAVLQGLRADSDWTGVAGLQAKAMLTPADHGNVAVALVAGTTFDLSIGESALSFVNMPVTFTVSDKVRVNLNSGWLYDANADHHHLTWGGGFEWDFADSVTLIGEVFGQTKPLSDPRFQAGIRYMPVGNVDLDIIYGSNLTGEREAFDEAAHWLTAGLTVRY